VSQGDVDEALRLMRASKSSLADNGGEGGARKEDNVSLCYRWVVAMSIGSHVVGHILVD
jgi:hypothetical protein